MTKENSSVDASRIVIGQPLPFSVYSSDRKLLLAKGRVVASEQMRRALIVQGSYQSQSDSLDQATESAQDEANAVPQSPLKSYEREIEATTGHVRVAMRLSQENSKESFVCHVLSADEWYGMMITAPRTAGDALVNVQEGQVWVFRTLYMTTALKFWGSIRKVQFEPIPVLYVIPSRVDMRKVRSSPRAATCVQATVAVGDGVDAIISDMCVGGLCVAVERKHTIFEIGQTLQVKFKLNVLDNVHELVLPATVMSLRPEELNRHPDLSVAGVRIDLTSDLERLVVHSYVQERLASSLNAIWSVLFTAR